MERARNRTDMRLQAPKHGRALVLLPAQRFIPLPPNNTFDDYFGGPSLEDMCWLQRPPGVSEFFLSGWYPQPTIRSPWELFKDYGYRLEPSFALMFNNEDPSYVIDHLLPIGHSQLDQVFPNATDTRIFSMADMLEEAGESGSQMSRELFVKGKTADGDFVFLDMELDEEPLEMEEIICSMDIDSIIWVTPLLQVKTELMVHILPYTGKYPPLSKHNHAYVELLMPQSEKDRCNNATRSEWYTIRSTISSIPHSHFAKIGGGAGSFNIYVFWPRMKHRNHLTGRWMNMVPWDIQSHWLTQVSPHECLLYSH
jgi:hypothetical protein